MIDAISAPNITNDNETMDNPQENEPNNLHIIKCEENNTELILLNLKSTERKLLKSLGKPNKKLPIVYGVIAIILTIISLSTLIKNNKYYINIKENLRSNSNKTYTKFWKDIGKYEIGVLIPFLIFHVILLLFNLFIYLRDRNIIKDLEINQGNIYYSLLILYFVFFTILNILPFLICYLNIYSIFVLAKIPNDFNSIDEYLTLNDKWKKKIILPIIHIVLNFLVFFLSIFIITPITYNLMSFLDMNFDNNQKEKNGILSINDLYFGITIKSGYLYLLQSEENSEEFYKIANLEKQFPMNRNEVTQLKKVIKCLAFKQIFIDDITNEYIYMILEYPSIMDQLPLANQGFMNLLFLFMLSLFFLFISIPSSKIHIKNEIDYINSIEAYNAAEKKPKYFGIYKIYGNFEETVTTIRIIYFALITCSLFILMIRRLIYGGFKNIVLIKRLIILFFLLLIISAIDIILSVITILFSIFCTSVAPMEESIENSEQKSEYSYKYTEKKLVVVSTIKIKLVFQIVVNALNLLMMEIGFIISTIQNLSHHLKIIKSWNQLNENIIYKDLNKEIVFKYRNLNNNLKILEEFRIEGFPKYLFYKHETKEKI